MVRFEHLLTCLKASVFTTHAIRATFIFKDNKLGVTAKGAQFQEFKSQFGADDRGFGYIKVMVRLS